MCLAVPAKIVEREGDTAWVLLGDSRLQTSLAIAPEADVGDWVLIHAGFAIRTLTEAEAKETFGILAAMEAAEDEDA